MSIDPITAGLNLGETILNKFFPDANEEMKLKFSQASNLIDKEYQERMGQIQINKEEAKHPSIFVAGARPAAMWLGILTFLYDGIGCSFISWVATIFGLPPLPAVDPMVLNNTLYMLLGLFGLRSVDKVKGVDTKTIRK